MNLPLKDQVRERFERQRLDNRQLERLQSVVNDTRRERPVSRRRLLTTAALLAVVSFGVGVALMSSLSGPHPDMIARIAEEVVRNHLKHEPLEISTDSFEALRTNLDQLGFRPIESPLLARLDLELVGGRYCSLQGLKAAQLRVRDRRGGSQTLYEVEYRPEVFGPLPEPARGETPAERYVKGVRVRIWREKGLVFALAGD